MDRLLRGVSKFRREVFPKHRQLFEELSNQQHPEALFITCADSRVVPDLITQTDPGDLFICRNAGNMVPPYGELHGGVSATIEYAVAALEVNDIIVCGHTDCGAMRGVLHPEKVADMPTVKRWLNLGEVARRVVAENYPDVSEDEKLRLLIKQNIVAQISNLHTHPSVAARLAGGHLRLHGWLYNIGTGQVEAWNGTSFVPIEEYQMESTAMQTRMGLAS